LVVARTHRNRSLKSPGEAAIAFNVAELGVIPTAKQAFVGRRLVRHVFSGGERLSIQAAQDASITLRNGERAVELITLQQKNSAVADSFRAALVSVVLSGNNGSSPRIVVLTSPGPREGKTTVASNLGLAMAEINRRVLLIEADVRRPALHKVFGIPNNRGLMELLAEPQSSMQSSLADYVAPTGVPNLYLLPCGRA